MDSKELRKQRIRDTKTELILDAALQVLAQKGYHDTRLEDIAENAGFSKSALYRYYKDKDEIFFAIGIRERNKVIDSLLSDPEYMLRDDLDICSNLRRMLTVSLSVLGNNFSFILSLDSMQILTFIHILQSQKKIMKIEEEFLHGEMKMDEIMVTLFDRAKAKGEITSTLSSMMLLRFLQGILVVCVKKWHLQKKTDDLQETIDNILEFLMHGMGITISRQAYQ